MQPPTWDASALEPEQANLMATSSEFAREVWTSPYNPSTTKHVSFHRTL